MNAFDTAILTAFGSVANRYPLLDAILADLQGDNLLKGAILLAGWWFVWFQAATEKPPPLMREKLLAGICATLLGIAVARSLANYLPYRLRPKLNPLFHDALPHTAHAYVVPDWSAFPSDHAVLWFALATTLLLLNRTVGVLCMVYAAFLGLGRTYLGIHYPTDVLAGALIGIASVNLLCRSRTVLGLMTRILHWGRARQSLFYAAMFAFTYEMANMFDEVRDLWWFGKSAVGAAFGPHLISLAPG